MQQDDLPQVPVRAMVRPILPSSHPLPFTCHRLLITCPAMYAPRPSRWATHISMINITAVRRATARYSTTQNRNITRMSRGRERQQ